MVISSGPPILRPPQFRPCYYDPINSFTAAGDFSRHEYHIDTRNSAVKELIGCA